MTKELLLNASIFAATFLVTTPGFLLEPVTFWQSLRLIGLQYSRGHWGYTVRAFGQHGCLLLLYLTSVLASRWSLMAIGISVAACVGVVATWKERPRIAMLFLCGPIAYALIAISFRVMMARNYLLFMPFLALFAARGAFYLGETVIQTVWLRRAMMACWVGSLGANLFFLEFAARNISPHPSVSNQEIVAYIRTQPRVRFLVSPRIADVLTKEKVNLSNVTRNPAEADRYILENEEVESRKLVCNRPGQYRYVSGPLDVNFDYYPDWGNYGKAFDLSIKRARKMKLITTTTSQ